MSKGLPSRGRPFANKTTHKLVLAEAYERLVLPLFGEVDTPRRSQATIGEGSRLPNMWSLPIVANLALRGSEVRLTYATRNSLGQVDLVEHVDLLGTASAGCRSTNCSELELWPRTTAILKGLEEVPPEDIDSMADRKVVTVLRGLLDTRPEDDLLSPHLEPGYGQLAVERFTRHMPDGADALWVALRAAHSGLEVPPVMMR